MPRVTITVPEKNAQPYRFQLDRPVVSLGRGSENDIAIESGSVSVHHAEMRRIEGGYELRDIAPFARYVDSTDSTPREITGDAWLVARY